MLLLFKALNVMYVGVPSGEFISSIIPVAFKTIANLWSLNQYNQPGATKKNLPGEK